MPRVSSEIEDELVRRHREAVGAVVGVFALSTLLLFVVAVREWSARLRPRTFRELVAEALGSGRSETPDPVLMVSMWLGVAFLGLGAIYFRRTKFHPVRLQAVAGLRGVAGLLKTLRKTTVIVALMGAAISVIGFASALISGFAGDMYRAWLIAAVVLAYAYPRRAGWRRVVEAADAPGAEAEPAAKGTFA